MALVAPDERAPAAGLTTAVRGLAQAVSPVLTGIALAHAAFGLPFFLAGGLKIVYDLALFARFRRVPLADRRRRPRPPLTVFAAVDTMPLARRRPALRHRHPAHSGHAPRHGGGGGRRRRVRRGSDRRPACRRWWRRGSGSRPRSGCRRASWPTRSPSVSSRGPARRSWPRSAATSCSSSWPGWPSCPGSCRASCARTTGTSRADDIRAARRPASYMRSDLGLVVLENTHNFAGGTVADAALMARRHRRRPRGRRARPRRRRAAVERLRRPRRPAWPPWWRGRTPRW